MKLFFLLLLIVLLSSNSNALQCVNHTDPIIFTALNVTEAIEFVDTLPTTEEYEVCYIVYQVLYPKNDFAVSFGADISQFPGDVNMNVYLEMELYMVSGVDVINPMAGHKTFYFKCTDGDACERHFWRNHIESFVKEDLTSLKEAFRSTLITEIQGKVQCDVRNKEKQETCQGDACFLTAMGPTTGCVQPNQQQTSILLRILTKFSVNATSPYGLDMQANLVGLGYICQFDHCNNEGALKKVTDALTFGNLHLSSIPEALSITLQEKQTTKPEGGSSSTSTESPKPEGGSSSTSTGSPKPGISSSSTSTSPNNSILHYIFMNILILHSLFLIFF